MKMKWMILGAVGTGACLLFAAEELPDEPLESSEVYSAVRSFELPVRQDPVGLKVSADRAFWGAPPVMPHSFSSEQDGRFCLTCHAKENRVEFRQQAIAPVPHGEFTQCQQCHVKQGDITVELITENTFVGLDLPGKGTRAHDYAPPTIPHKTFMRDNCMACHGPMGKQRIQSPHPQRSQCQQCHVPDASKNYDRPLDWMNMHGQF